MAENKGDHVLIAIDGSDYAVKAFDWYFDHMHRPENTVVLVHCMDIPAVPSRDTWEQQTKEGKNKGQAIVDVFIAKLTERKITPNIVMDFEKPGPMIISVSKKEKSDVIVMGTRGMGKLRRTILGSVSNYVLNHSDVPVLVVRDGKNGDN